MSERGNTTHSARLDEELKHETQSIVQGHGPSHVEEFRQTEPLPDDTDDAEVLEASGMDGGFVDADDPIVHRSPADDADDADGAEADDEDEEEER
jgi:hypothetical protein